MRLVRKWWPGLLPLGLIWALAAWTQTRPLEADLAARASAALNGALLDKVRLMPAGRDIDFSAEAFSDQGRAQAVAALSAVQGLRVLSDRTTLLPDAVPFAWSARREVSQVVLSGHAPSPAARTQIVEAARGVAGSLEVSDQMAFARGAAPNFDAAAKILTEQLGRLADGEVQISATAVKLTGMARDLGGREAIAAALRDLPQGFTVAENAIKAPPYVFQANKDPVTATVTLTGNVPENAHNAIVAAATRKFFSEKIADQLKDSVGAPSGFVNAVTTALGDLSRLSTGSLVISDRSVNLSGDAFYEAASAQIRDTMPTRLPQGWQATTDISVRPVAGAVDSSVCQQLLSEVLAQGKIRFDRSRATIDSDSAALLDHLVAIALRCPQASLEISGHTDSDGDEQTNMILSERRAHAVAAYLTAAGLPVERLQPVGYGRSRPIAPNDTEDGKMQNRRIEFLVKE